MAWWPWAVGGAGVVGLILLSTKKASAGQNAPVGMTATVTASPGIKARTAPSLSAPLIAPEGQSPNDAFEGTTVRVLKTGIKPTDNSGGEWWQIVTPGGGTGFARAVDPQGGRNFSATSGVAGIGAITPGEAALAAASYYAGGGIIPFGLAAQRALGTEVFSSASPQCVTLFEARYPYLAQRAEANLDDATLVRDIDWVIFDLATGYSGCDKQIRVLQSLRAQVLAARGVGPSGIGPLFGPNAYVAPTPREFRRPGVAQVPAPYAPTAVLPGIPGGAVSPAGTVPVNLQIYTPQRGGPASAAAAYRAAMFSSPVR